MNRFQRYTVALLVGTVATGVVAVSRGEPVGALLTAPQLSLATFCLYAAATEITLRFPALLWGDDAGGLPAGVFAGGLTFGATALASGLPETVGIGPAVVGVGLCVFGAATGFWMAHDANDGSRRTVTAD